MLLPSSALGTLTTTATLIRVAALTGAVSLRGPFSCMAASTSTTGNVPIPSRPASVVLVGVRSRYVVEPFRVVRILI